MNGVLAFAIVMAVWTFSDFVSKKKTKSLLSSLFIASIIFFVGASYIIRLLVNKLPKVNKKEVA